MILISGGHHTHARGATHEGNSEFPETRIWAELIVHRLKALDLDAAVVCQGKLRKKVKEINNLHSEINCKLAIEVHFNSLASGRARGCETLYYPGSIKGKLYAERIQETMVRFFPPDRGIKEGWYKMDRPGVVDYHGDVDGDEKIDYFLRKTPCPALIIEPEFIQYYEDIAANRKVCCRAIAETICKIFS